MAEKQNFDIIWEYVQSVINWLLFLYYKKSRYDFFDIINYCCI